MSNRTSLLNNQYFHMQIRDAVERLHVFWESTSTPNRIHPYRDVACGEVLKLLIDALVSSYYGPQAENQKAAFRGCCVGLMLEVAHCDGIGFDEDVLKKCVTVRHWYRKFVETRQLSRPAR